MYWTIFFLHFGFYLILLVFKKCKPAENKTDVYFQLKSAILYSLFFITDLVYPSYVSTIISMLNCRNFDKIGSFLVADLAVQCRDANGVPTAKYQPYFVGAVFLCFIFVIGVPLTFILAIWGYFSFEKIGTRLVAVGKDSYVAIRKRLNGDGEENQGTNQTPPPPNPIQEIPAQQSTSTVGSESTRKFNRDKSEASFFNIPLTGCAEISSNVKLAAVGANLTIVFVNYLFLLILFDDSAEQAQAVSILVLIINIGFVLATFIIDIHYSFQGFTRMCTMLSVGCEQCCAWLGAKAITFSENRRKVNEQQMKTMKNNAKRQTRHLARQRKSGPSATST